ncbi:MAG TPA: STAS/SEC14 domain-containing protein, partial [Myxococcales bacterium]|nr:STAS/SEC14 domain-containing protein [Myxococcales bacterium]
KNEIGEMANGQRYLRIEISGALRPDELKGGVPEPRLAGGMPRLLVADDTARLPSETRRLMAQLPCVEGSAPAAAVTSCGILRVALQLLSRALGGTLRFFSSEEEALAWLGSLEHGPRLATAA